MRKPKKIEKIVFDRPWGAHTSTAGGVSTAPPRAGALGLRSIQIFTKNNNQWKGKPLTVEEIDRYARNVRDTGVDVFAAHDCYLINLASPVKETLEKSRAAFLDEMDRADALGIKCLVFHPGAHMGTGEEEGLGKVAESLRLMMKERPESRVILTLETTAGQGTSLGYRFEHLARIIELTGAPERMGVCVDTCHIFASGYEINTPDGYRDTFREFDRVIGLDRLKMFHINDSKRELGSRVDRHEHIGEGHIGLEGFRLLVNDPRFTDIPMILETPKGPEGAEDVENLKTLRALIKKEKHPRRRAG